MPDDLYEDALAWSEQQANLLRRLAAGERVNDDVDLANVIKEIQDVGLSQLRAVRSLLAHAMEHLLKIHGWPDGPVEYQPRLHGVHALAGERAEPISREPCSDLRDDARWPAVTALAAALPVHGEGSDCPARYPA